MGPSHEQSMLHEASESTASTAWVQLACGAPSSSQGVIDPVMVRLFGVSMPKSCEARGLAFVVTLLGAEQAVPELPWLIP